ncbi:MAG: hypothetical protein E7324_07585 [Clostridiales bacterium]|nr:hypothetical protein [Clostridiales bacterium]
MDMQFVMDRMETEQVFSARPTQAVVEAEVTLPGGLREEARVYYADATLALGHGEMTGNRIQADGRVTFHVLYGQGDLSKVSVLETAADFSQALPLKEENTQQASLLVRPRGEVQHVSAKVFNGRLLLQAIVQLRAEAMAPRTLSYVRDVAGAEGIEKAMQTLAIQRAVGEGEGQTLLREEFELSDVLQIRDTLYATGSAKVEDILGGQDGKATVTGVIQLQAYHTAGMPGRPLVYTRHSMPFEQQVNLTGALGDALAARTAVKDVAVLCQEGENGSKIMRAEVQLFTEITALADGNAEMIRDVFTTQGDQVETRSQQVIYRTGMVQETAAESGKTVMLLPEGSPRVKTALLGFVRPVLLKAEKQQGKLTAEGILETALIYLTDDSTVPVAIQQEEPFRAVFSLDAEPEDDLQLTALQAEASPVTGDRVELKYILELHAEGMRKSAAQVIVDARTVAAEEDQKGVTLCFLQPGEGLWDVARRYRVPLQQLQQMNPDVKETAGTCVIAYKR